MRITNQVISLMVGNIEYSRIQLIKDVFFLSNSSVCRLLFDEELTLMQLYDKAYELRHKKELTATDCIVNGIKII